MPLTVLIVEDELVTAEPLVLILSWAGLVVKRVRDAEEALAALRRTRPDVVLVNERLPHGRGGLALCRTITRDRTLAPVPVVVFGAPDECDVRWREAGAAAFLRKPIDLRLLPAALEKLVAAWRERNAPAELRVS